MLVLTRKRGERIVIRVPGLATPIVVAVLEIDRNKVRLGTAAPRDVRVDREEMVAAKGAGKAE